MRTPIIAFLLPSLLAGCGDRIVYVFADAGPQPTSDAGPPTADGAPALDAPDLPADTCLPDRTPGEVSSADCHRYAAEPVCDGTTSTCVAAPSHYCAACETDEQCQLGVDLRADCVFLPRPSPYPSDQACLSPCDTDADCDFLPRPEWTGVQCVALERGSYCVVPFTSGEATCSDFAGGRRGDGI